MFILYKVLLVIHICAAVVTIGPSFGVLRNLRRGLELGRETFALSAEDSARRGKMMSIASILLLLSGISLIFTIGGFKAAPLNIHIALALMLVALAVSITFVKPQVAKIVELSRAESLSREEIRATLKKLAMGQGISHLLWLCILVLMLVRIAK